MTQNELNIGTIKLNILLFDPQFLNAEISNKIFKMFSCKN